MSKGYLLYTTEICKEILLIETFSHVCKNLHIKQKQKQKQKNKTKIKQQQQQQTYALFIIRICELIVIKAYASVFVAKIKYNLISNILWVFN